MKVVCRRPEPASEKGIASHSGSQGQDIKACCIYIVLARLMSWLPNPCANSAMIDSGLLCRETTLTIVWEVSFFMKVEVA